MLILSQIWLPVHCQDVSILRGDLVNLGSESCILYDLRSFLGLWRLEEGPELLTEELSDARQNPNRIFGLGQLRKTDAAGVLDDIFGGFHK